MPSQRTLLPVGGGAGAMASGFDASAWDTPQVALFEALGEVVDNVGARNAAYLAHRVSSNSPSREFLERMRRLESDSKLAQEVRMLLGESVQRYSLPHSASEAEAFQTRLRHLMVKEQILDTLSTDAGFAKQFLMGIGSEYEGMDLHRLAEAMVGMRGKVTMLERALGVEGEKMTPEEMENKVAEWRAKARDWDNYVTGAGKKLSEAREVERGEDAERQLDRDATDHTSEEPSVALIPISNPASPRPHPNQSNVEVKEDRKKQQAKLKKAIDANRLLQTKLRQVSDNRNRWSEYCEHLQKKLERSNALLKDHQVAKELMKTAEPEEGGPSRPQTVEREEVVADIVTLQPEHSEVAPAVLPVFKEAMGPTGRAERGSSTKQTLERDAVPDGVRPEAPHEGVPPALTPQEFHSLYQPKPKTTYKSRPPIAIPPPNARICGDDENGLLPPLLVETYGQRSAYWSGTGSGDTKERGPIYSKNHPMARGGLTIANCSTDALEVLEKIKPGEGFVVDDKMRKALRNYKLPASGDPLAAPHALAATQEENNIQDNPSNIDGDDSSAEKEPDTSAFINKLAVFRAQRGKPFQHHKARIGSNQVDLEALYMAVTGAGGFDQVTQERLGWLKMASRLGFTDTSDVANRLKICYWRFLAAWEIKDMHGKEPPPKQMLEDSSHNGLARLARALTGDSENENPDSEVETMQQDIDMAKLGLNSPAPGTPQPAMINKSAIPTEPASTASSPKLPKLLHTTTVPDSLASSSSVSQHHTSSTQAEHPTSGAVTINAEEANQANAAAARPPPSNDEPPVVVSERNVRKRKHNGSPPKKKIKQECIESSPIALLDLRHLQTQESMDLDDIGPKTATPKKRREKQSATGASGLSEEYAPAQVYPQAPTFTSSKDYDNQDQDAPDTPLPSKPSPGTPIAPPSAASILKPRSTNPILPRTSAKTYSAKRCRISDKGADLFSEDGENHLRDADSEEATRETPSKAVPRAVAGRLAGLLEKPNPRRWQVMNMDDEPDSASASDSNSTAQPAKSSTKSTIAPRQTVHERLAAQRVEVRKSMNKPKQRDYEADNDMPDLGELVKAKQMKVLDGKAPETPVPAPKINAAARSVNARNKVREAVPSTARPEEESLATRPVSRLSLDDFRINPEYNNGLDYAYRDVVRGREKRKCLAGCTDPSCCGKGFRALAEIATPIRDNLTSTQREEEDKLLTEFLGRDATRLIKHMGKEERRETVIKAKMRELANKHGKHRHAYERRKSPPGFWRADFPTTQEEAEDREKAKVFERDLVQKRYEEAMRGGGKWIFKDQMDGQPGWVDKE